MVLHFNYFAHPSSLDSARNDGLFWFSYFNNSPPESSSLHKRGRPHIFPPDHSKMDESLLLFLREGGWRMSFLFFCREWPIRMIYGWAFDFSILSLKSYKGERRPGNNRTWKHIERALYEACKKPSSLATFFQIKSQRIFLWIRHIPTPDFCKAVNRMSVQYGNPNHSF